MNELLLMASGCCFHKHGWGHQEVLTQGFGDSYLQWVQNEFRMLGYSCPGLEQRLRLRRL